MTGRIAPHCQLTLRSALLTLMTVLLCSAAGSAVGQTPVSHATESPGQHGAVASEPRRLPQLGPGDQLSIQVYGQSDMDATVYVGDDGTVRVPLVGPVHVADLSPLEAAQRIEQALINGQYLVDPHVTISVLSAPSQRVSVLGEVHSPGRYAIAPDTSLFDVLALAGGVTENAADFLYIQRFEPDGRPVRYRVGRDTAATQVLQSGDAIEVPTADQFYIYGEVSNPSKYRIEPGMTVVQAIARAGGVTPRGSERRVDVKRVGSDGHYVVRHAEPGDLVEPNDVIRVKESIF